MPGSARPHHAARYDAAMVLVSLIWGINFSVTKYALALIPVYAFAGLRFLGASALLYLVYRLVEGKAESALPRRTLAQLIGLGILGNTLYQLGFLEGLSRTTATNSAVLIAFIPVMVAILGAILGVERATPRVILGVVIGTTGVLVIVLERGGGGPAFGGATTIGDLLTLGTGVLWAFYTLGIRTVARGISPLRVTMITTIAGTPGLLLAGTPDLLRHSWGSVPASAWGALVYASAGSIVVAYLIWNISVQAIGTNRTSLYACVTPVFAAGAAWVLLGERFVPLQYLGAALVLGSVLVARR